MEQKAENKRRYNELWSLTAKIRRFEENTDTIAARMSRMRAEASRSSELRELKRQLEWEKEQKKTAEFFLKYYEDKHKKCPCLIEQ